MWENNTKIIATLPKLKFLQIVFGYIHDNKLTASSQCKLTQTFIRGRIKLHGAYE